MKKVLLNVLFILYSVALIGQIDTEFWFAAPEVSKNDFYRFDEPIVLRLTTLSIPAFVNISMPAETSFIPIQVSIGADTSVSVDLSPWLELLENKPANTILNKGIHIKSTTPITAYYDVVSSYCNCNPELYSLKGKNALGKEFLLPGQTQFINEPSYSPTPYNAFDIVATEDNTTVTITPAKDIVGHSEKEVFQIVLNKGQTWSGVATGQSIQSHLHGTELLSDKLIAVTVTDDLLHDPNNRCGGDLIGDQIIPVNMAGNEFVGVRGFLTNGGDRLYVLGLANNTELFFDGSTTPVSINRGEVFNHLIQNYSTHLSTSSPVLVYQTSGYGCEFGSAVLPQVQCTGSKSVSVFRSNDYQFGLLLITEAGNETGFRINGDSTTVLVNDFSEVPGTNGHWLAARVVLSTAQVPVGTTCIISNRIGLFHMGLINGGSDIGCSYGFFSNFNSLELGSDLTICAGDTAILDAGFGMEPYLWSTGSTARSISVNTPGEYWVQAGVGSCQLSDTIKINIQQLPAIDFGPDTLAVCGAISGIISVPGGYSNYQWNIPGNNNILEVTSPGIYSCQITDSIGCKASDSVYVTFGPLPADLGQPINPPVDLQTGLVAYYPFNGNANDESGNGNHGVVNGAVLTTDRFGINDNAYSFDGSQTNIYIPASVSLDITNDLSISAWFVTSEYNLSGQQQILWRGDLQGGLDPYSICFSQGNLHFRRDVSGGSNSLNHNGDSISFEDFHHVVGTFNGLSGQMSLYLDGIIVENDYLPGISDYPTSSFWNMIGSVDHGNWQTYRGKIDDIRIYNRALTAEEVQCLYTGDCQQLFLAASQGATTLCRGGASSITLFNAQAGVSYQVKDNNLDIGLPQVGNADTLI
ncbi:MAG: hypothetical protein JNL22_13825, partial [Bacteroidales bacterium]|nr:hypothetical protein [Bacteroidales bacterium]